MRWTLATVVALAGLWPVGKVQAQTAPNAPTSQFAPVKTPTLDPELLKPPKATPDDSAVKFNTGKTDKATSGFTLPNRVGLGQYDLQFKAGRTGDVNPRTGYDSGETSNLSTVRPGRKSDSALPDYFGLKLTAPAD